MTVDHPNAQVLRDFFDAFGVADRQRLTELTRSPRARSRRFPSGAVVEVRGTADIDAVFCRLVPHFGVRRVGAEVTADAQQGPARDQAAPTTLTPVTC